MSQELVIGDLTIHRIIEQQTPFMSFRDMLPDLTAEVLAENMAWLKEGDAIGGNEEAIFCFQSYVVRTPDHVILIDSAIGNDKPRHRPLWNMQKSERYLKTLKAAGFSVADIDYVMCTHLHPDHVGWNTRLENNRWVPTFPNAKYVFGKSEFESWERKNAETPVAPIVDSVLPIVEAGRADLVDSTFTIGDHVRVMATPGHTKGHNAYIFGRGKDAVVFSGDLMHSPLQVRYPEFSPKFDFDRQAAAATRRAFLERYCDTDTLICPIHFPWPRKIREGRNGFAFEAQ
ncbi:MAG: MBL fold metallo-hydrolase [Bradyrhizobium sp.]|nr:MBL fold metallo-hydrolase [Bradyrhizobium sp.]